jgi:hypothetical protein
MNEFQYLWRCDHFPRTNNIYSEEREVENVLPTHRWGSKFAVLLLIYIFRKFSAIEYLVIDLTCYMYSVYGPHVAISLLRKKAELESHAWRF